MTQQAILNTQQECNIFIVDDNEQQANLMQEMAKTAQLKAQVFTSSIDFLESTITQYDIIVLDLQMPDKDGIEIMRELASKNIKPHFILVSGFDERVLHSAKQLAESKQLNVVTTLTKPFKAKDFIALLIETHKSCTLKKSQQIENNNHTNNAQFSTNQVLNTDIISIEDLKLAIRRHELIIHYQPQICFNNNQLQGAEIILRWQHPSKGLILPEEFIPIAEKHRLMNLLTEEILMLAIKDHKKITKNKLDIKVAINLSAQSINDLSMPEKLEALVKSNNINPDFFSLEITESALMNGVSESLDILNRLRMKGFLLSIDDFGTGHSSLVTLYQAPFTELKIDQQFVKHITVDNDAAAIVKICILLAKELNMRCIAEGVETQETWDKLKKLGCDIAQGDFVASPMPIDDFIDWVGNRNCNPL